MYLCVMNATNYDLLLHRNFAIFAVRNQLFKKMTKFHFYFLLFLPIVMNSCTSKKENQNYEENKVSLMTDEKLNQLAKDVDSLFSAPEEFHEGVISYQENGKFGFKNQNGEVVIPAKYGAVGCFSEGLVSVTINGKDGYINHAGELVIPTIYDFTNYFSQGLAVACKDGKFGYIDKQGNTVIDFIYDDARDFFEPEGFAAVRKDGKEGLIDRKGDIVMPIIYESAMSTSDGVATIFDGTQEISVYNDRSYRIIEYK